MTTDRDRLIRAALAPSADLAVPADLGESVFARLAETPQRRAGWTTPLRRRLPESGSTGRLVLVWVAALLLVIAALAAIGVASQRVRVLPPDVVSYRGHPSQDSVLRGPAPMGTPGIAWQVDLQGPMTILGLPLVRDGIAWFVDTRGHVQAVEAASGAERWSTSGPGMDSPAPVLLGPILVVVAKDGMVVGLDADTGRERWRRSLEPDVIAPLAGTDDTVLVSSSSGAIVALSATDGSRRYAVDAGGPVSRSPAITDGVAYAVADTGMATAFDLETGGSIWVADLAADDREPLVEPETLTPVVSGGMVYVTRGGKEIAVPHELVAIDAATGTVRWRWASPTVDRIFVGAVTDDRVYLVGEDGAVWSLALDGTDATMLYRAAGAIGSPASVVGDELFVTSADGVIHALDRRDGTLHWQVAVAGIPTMPVISDGRVIVGTNLGKAVALASGS